MNIDSAMLHQAIVLALNGDWKKAIEVNLQILKSDPQDTETLNRLGRAYLETNQKSKAKAMFDKVIVIDKFNTIAQKNLKKIKIVRPKSDSFVKFAISPVFLEEPGVTRTVTLIRAGDPKVLETLVPGECVLITSREHNVTVLSQAKHYLGRIPDDLASRLRPLLKSGNTYSAWVRSIDYQTVKIFIKELTRSHKYRNTPSFPVTEKLTYAAFTPPELVHEEKPDVSATEFQEDNAPDQNNEVEAETQES